MEKITESINIVLNNSEQIMDTIIGIGIGVHGIVDYRKGISVYAPAFDWRDLDIKSIIEGRFNMPVFIDNDVRTMALGERWFGAARSVDNFVFINVGSGIGSGIMINGELYTGKNFSAGEVGHISIADNGPKCNCGNYGCLEVMASGPAIVKRVVSQIKMGKATAITKLVNDDLSKITGEIIHMAAKMGDTVAADALQETGRYIGIAVSSIINILNPELILIGGGVSNAGDFIFKPLIEVAKKKSMKDAGESVGILPAALGENCGVVGAATLVIKDLFQVPKFV
jgi:glucokinase-like ROK family protein